MKSLSLMLLTLAFSGCVTTTYEKSVTVKKDAAGNIIGIEETERVVQPGGSGWPVKFEHLKGVQSLDSKKK